MTDYICTTCASKVKELHTHHIIPQALGGTDLPGNLINICLDCHSKIHDRQFIEHSALTKAGIQRAKANGRVVGRPKIIDPETLKRAIASVILEGNSIRSAAQVFGISKSQLAVEIKKEGKYVRSFIRN